MHTAGDFNCGPDMPNRCSEGDVAYPERCPHMPPVLGRAEHGTVAGVGRGPGCWQLRISKQLVRGSAIREAKKRSIDNDMLVLSMPIDFSAYLFLVLTLSRFLKPFPDRLASIQPGATILIAYPDLVPGDSIREQTQCEVIKLRAKVLRTRKRGCGISCLVWLVVIFRCSKLFREREHKFDDAVNLVLLLLPPSAPRLATYGSLVHEDGHKLSSPRLHENNLNLPNSKNRTERASKGLRSLDRVWGFCGSMAATATATRTELENVVSTIDEAKAKVDPELTCSMQVEYPSEELARIVMVTLSVDAELQPDKVARTMEVRGGRLSISFRATDARFLRASFSSFMDMLVLATRTIEEFGPSSIHAASA
ncbi:hypothetical protein AXG93_3384s1120 [Marchantia polymorpha subsp. ruderalis]|uniref:Uncharacterized protein n=2 Tax=Marchantia polymorpha TaxID=3197 RepID=A0A176WEG3_MARPO|nr:hypothetical protein AXG93_3384s1120 [Marchantia polymorpha subsp. ruderalis]